MSTISDYRTKSSQPQLAIVKNRKEIQKGNRALENYQAHRISKYSSFKKICPVAAGAILENKATKAAYSQSKPNRDRCPVSISQSVAKSPCLLVIGYGYSTNESSSPGCQIPIQIQSLGLENVYVCAVEQLTPELSSKLSTADYAIFVHGCWMKTPEVKVSELNACGLESTGSSIPGYGHSWPPCSLLALTNSIYSHYPQSWLLKVPNQIFKTNQHCPDWANQIVHITVEQIELIYQCIHEANC